MVCGRLRAAAVCAYNCRPMSRRLTIAFIAAATMSILSMSRAADPQMQLVDIATVDPTIIIDLRYATEHNVTGHQLYRSGTKAMVLPSVAQQLVRAQLYLKQFRYHLKVWDAYRPKAAEELLW